MLSRQEVNTMRHLANAQYWDRPAGGNTGRLFLAFGGPVCADQISNCPLDRVLTYKNLIYLLNLQIPTSSTTTWEYLNLHVWLLDSRNPILEDSHLGWQKELRHLRGNPQEKSINQGGPFLGNGAHRIRWTSPQQLFPS